MHSSDDTQQRQDSDEIEDVDDIDEAFNKGLPEFRLYEKISPYVNYQLGAEFKAKKYQNTSRKTLLAKL